MLDFNQMCADDIANYEGPVYWYSMQFKSRVLPRGKVDFDGEHTTPEHRNNTINSLLSDRGTNNLIGPIRIKEYYRKDGVNVPMVHDKPGVQLHGPDNSVSQPI